MTGQAIIPQNFTHGQRANVAGLILPDEFNIAAGGNIQTPARGIWTPPKDDDGYTMQDGILQKDAQVYTPKTIYFLPSQLSVSARRFAAAANVSPAGIPLIPASAPAPSQPDCFNILDDLLLEEKQNFAERNRDMNWFGRVGEAVLGDIDGERAAMGLPTLKDELARKKRDFH